MANKDHPHGLLAVMSRMKDTPRMTLYPCNATTAIFRGDVVILKTNGRISTLGTAAGVANIVGVAAAYNPAGTTPVQSMLVYDDPDTVFEIQDDSTTDPGATTNKVNVGANANLTLTTGDTNSGQSKHELDHSSITTAGVTAALKIMGFYDIVDNDISLKNARFLVMLNRHIWQKGVAI